MIKEIGGYFEVNINDSFNKEFYPSLISLNSARNALVYICKSRKIKKVYFPYYLCDSCYKVCERENIEFDFYEIDDNFLPCFEKDLKKDEFIYVVNYFGFITNKQIKKMKDKYKNIILDNVQAFFRKPIRGIDTIYSCRKFFGVPDGAYLSSDCLKLIIDKDDSSKRLKHLYGRKETTASKYYDEYLLVEKQLYSLPLLSMSEITHNLLCKQNYRMIKNTRNKNFKYLKQKLDKYNDLKIGKIDGPYMYPLKCKNAKKLRNLLIENLIYTPILWPQLKNDVSNQLAESLLILPCDQRCDLSDLNRIVSIVEENIYE